jgi:hypothetical protein
MPAKWQLPVELGTLGINRYVHRECQNAFLEEVARSGQVPEEGRSKEWNPSELIGLFSDIVSCDQCGRTFAATDSGYVSFWITTREELKRIARGNDPRPWWKFWR